jgi:hypothetical protein
MYFTPVTIEDVAIADIFSWEPILRTNSTQWRRGDRPKHEKPGALQVIPMTVKTPTEIEHIDGIAGRALS